MSMMKVVKGIEVEMPTEEASAWQSTLIADPAPMTLPLTARQLRLGLLTYGFALEQVEEAIAAIEDPQQRSVASIEWEYAAQFERGTRLLRRLARRLG